MPRGYANRLVWAIWGKKQVHVNAPHRTHYSTLTLVRHTKRQEGLVNTSDSTNYCHVTISIRVQRGLMILNCASVIHTLKIAVSGTLGCVMSCRIVLYIVLYRIDPCLCPSPLSAGFRSWVTFTEPDSGRPCCLLMIDSIRYIALHEMYIANLTICNSLFI